MSACIQCGETSCECQEILDLIKNLPDLTEQEYDRVAPYLECDQCGGGVYGIPCTCDSTEVQS